MNRDEVIKRALLRACKYLREHPPADAGWDGDMEIISLLIDAKSDPEGTRWVNYFVKKVIDEEWV